MSSPNIPINIYPINHYSLSQEALTTIRANEIWVIDIDDYEFIKRLNNSDSVIQIGPVATVETLENMWLTFIFSGSGGLIILVVLWTFTVQRRIKYLEAIANDFGAGKLESRADTHSRIRLSSLNTSFNQMADKIQSLLKSHKALISNISHELRTPISRIRFELEYGFSLQPNHEHQAVLESISEDINDLDKLVNELLTFSKFEHSELKIHFETVSMQEWMSHWEKKYRLLPSHITLRTFIHEVDFFTDIHEDSFSRAINNVVSNASRYAQSRINIHCLKNKEWAIIRIEDDGQGIPEEKWPTIFEPFIREDKSRSRKTGGYGLGLAIVNQIMQRHDGFITLSHSPLGGACFELHWPIKHAAN